MLAANDLRAILNAAEQAAARKDAAAAERLLREALALQESTPGSPRDEIARTLNNLAVVCEMTGKLKDAETCYRRALTIATASLPPTDPFVTTSRENLEAFCKAQGLPVASAAPAPPRAAPPAPQPANAPPRAASSAAESKAAPEARTPSSTPQRSPVAAAVSAETTSRARGVLIGVLLVAALAVAIVLARSWLTRSSVSERAETASQSEPVATVPPAVESPRLARAPDPPPVPPEPVPGAATPGPIAPKAESRRETRSSSFETRSPSSLTVVSAQLCRSLSTTGAWQCESASGTLAPGPMYFYTRVASARDTVVEHRWYHDGSLHQSVELHIGANPIGFRTYSRRTIGPDRAGTWKVEMRAEDGRVLHEETFAVR